MCRRTEEVVPTVGLPRHRHVEGFFKMSVKASTRGEPFYTVIPRNCPIQTPFTTRWGYGGHILDLSTLVLTGPLVKQCLLFNFG